MRKSRKKLTDRAAAIGKRIDEIRAAADARADSDDNAETFTQEERDEIVRLREESTQIRADLEALDAMDAADTRDWLERRNLSGPGAAADGQAAEFDDGTRFEDPAQGVYRSLGENLRDIYLVAADNGRVPERLQRVQELEAERARQAGPTGGSVNVGGDGGFAVEARYAGELWQGAMGMASIAPLCDEIPIGVGQDRLHYLYPEKDDRRTGQRWGGVMTYWRAEADTVDPSKPGFTEGELKLQELISLAYATERRLEDVVQLEAMYRQSFSEEFSWILDDSVVVGSGAGRPLGFLNAPCLVEVPVEDGQTADEPVLAENILKMDARLPQRLARGGAVWLINEQLKEVLPKLQIGTGASGQLVYMPPGGLSGSQYATLQGKPVIPVEQCPAMNSKGDIILAALKNYALIRKGQLRSASSMHVRFLHSEMAFRWTMRVNGEPKLRKQITPAKAQAGFKQSAFVTLAARS